MIILDLEKDLENRLQETRPFVVVHLEARAHDGLSLVFEQDLLRFSSFPLIREIRVTWFQFPPSCHTMGKITVGNTVKRFGKDPPRHRGPKEQASFMSPMRAAIDRRLHPTNHTDFVVAPLDQMFMVWSAVNRVSRGGQVIGPEQRVSTLEALKAITIDAARQYGEEASKYPFTGRG